MAEISLELGVAINKGGWRLANSFGSFIGDLARRGYGKERRGEGVAEYDDLVNAADDLCHIWWEGEGER